MLASPHAARVSRPSSVQTTDTMGGQTNESRNAQPARQKLRCQDRPRASFMKTIGTCYVDRETVAIRRTQDAQFNPIRVAAGGMEGQATSLKSRTRLVRCIVLRGDAKLCSIQLLLYLPIHFKVIQAYLLLRHVACRGRTGTAES